MAVRTTKTADKVGGGGEDRVKTPGWYHVFCNYSSDTTKKGKPVEGIATEFAVLPGQTDEGKVFETVFFDPDPTKAEDDKGNLMAQRKQTAFLVATGLITEQQMGGEVEYDTDHAVERQLVINLVLDNSDKNAGKGYLQLNFDDVLHVDDPRVAELVKAKKLKLNEQAIKHLPPTMRRKPESFDLEKLGGKKKASGTNGNGNGQHAKQQASNLVGAGAGAGSSGGNQGVDLDSI